MRRIINLALLSALICTLSSAMLPDSIYDKYIALDKDGKYKEAVSLLTPYAHQGDDEAQFYIGFLYQVRLGNVGEAIK
ncbi:hypothetical protein [Campylobacter sp. CCUG 57310]|uniref:hypothetical protein n=1 Tax=Campylobacter sp. CCUG 57310 TaxID=2517362 RepID=UPI001563BC5C|nr:hypothetical protein [Campylobacter sp. CCUG 57310]